MNDPRHVVSARPMVTGGLAMGADLLNSPLPVLGALPVAESNREVAEILSQSHVPGAGRAALLAHAAGRQHMPALSR